MLIKKGVSLVVKRFVVLAIVVCSFSTSAQNIIDYYNTLPETVFTDKNLGNIKYPLSKKANTWVSKSLAGYEFTPVVDIKNGFIEFNDEGTGGGNLLVQIVLFRKANRSPLIGVTMGGFNGFYFDSSTTFYERKNKKWIAAQGVLPEVEDFLKKEYVQSKFENDTIITPNLTVLTELPQFGTIVKCELNFNKYDYLIESNFNPYQQKTFTQKQQNKLWEIIENIAIESFQLKFNKSKGKFEVVDSTFLNSTAISTPANSDEEVIISRIWELKEVENLAAYIDSASQHKRNLKLIFDGEVADKPNYYLVRGIEDNGGNLVTHLIFHVHKTSFEIYQYNVITDDFIKIEN